jgi:hypothetical protein
VANRGDACRYRSISGEVYDGVLTNDPWEDAQRGTVVDLEIKFPGVGDPVSLRRVKFRAAAIESVGCIVCVAWPKEAEHGEAQW